MITGGIQSAVNSLRDAEDDHGRAKALAEIRAAITAQRQGLVNLVNFDPHAVSSVMREIMQHNAQFPEKVVLAAHTAMLVRPGAAQSSQVGWQTHCIILGVQVECKCMCGRGDAGACSIHCIHNSALRFCHAELQRKVGRYAPFASEHTWPPAVTWRLRIQLCNASTGLSYVMPLRVKPKP